MIFYLIAGIVYFLLGTYLVYLDPASKINRKFFYVTTSLLIWAVGFSMSVGAVNEVNSVFWRRVASFGWGSFYAFLLHFIFYMVRDKYHSKIFRMIEKYHLEILLYIPALLVIYVFGISNELSEYHYDMTKTIFGWRNLSVPSNWDQFFNIYFISYSMFGLLLLFRWKQKTFLIREKKQATFIILSYFIAFSIGTITDIVLDNFVSIETPEIGVLIIMIPVLAIWYSTQKLGFMSLSPATIAEDILVNMNDSLIMLDHFGEINNLNESAERLFGYSKENLIGKKIDGLIPGIDIKKEVKGKVQVIADSQGEIKKALLTATQIKDPWNQIIGIVFIFSDLSEVLERERELEKFKEELEFKVKERTEEIILINKRLEYLAYHDHLTGLPNRFSLIEMIKDSINKNISIALIYLDLDDFKVVNDTAGHQSGDELLVYIANKLKLFIEGRGSVSRVGGDEFVIILKNFEDKKEVYDLGEKLMNIFTMPFLLHDDEYFLKGSAGIAFYPENSENPEDLLKSSDLAMHYAKKAGKNQFIIFSGEMLQKLEYESQMVRDLNRAIINNEFELYYQPQIDLLNERIISLEALLRWNNEKYKSLSPAVFIPLAEQNGLISDIGNWVFEEVCSQLNKWKKEGKKIIPVAVNISLDQFKKEIFPDNLFKIMEKYNIEGELFEFELTESMIMSELYDIASDLKKIKDKGIKIAIDDFGKEYSSLSRIRNIPIDKIKIDKEFIRGLSTDLKDKAIIKAVLMLGKSLKVKVIAEGVEKQEEVDFLKENGCDQVQGYFYHKPLSAIEISKLF